MRIAGPRIALAVFCVLVLVLACVAPGHSVESMDVRTYAQMTRGIVESGLPCWHAGPVAQFPELLVPWAIESHGRVCGIYGPLYPYVGAPAFALGGLVGLIRFTIALSAGIAVATFLLAKQVLRDEWLAFAACVLAVLGTPIAARSLESAAFPLAALLATLATLALVRALEPARPSALLAIGTGVAWAAAAATHAVCFAMAIAGVGLLLARRPNAGLRAALGLGLGLLPSALLNRYRFGAWSPLSYGPIPWAHVNPELHKMTLGAQLGFALPLVALVGSTVIAAWVMRRRVRVQVALVAGAVLLILLVPMLRGRAMRFLVVATGLLFDMNGVDMGARYAAAPDGIGLYFGPHVVKSILQCTPLLALAPLALRGAGEARDRLLALLVPPAALVAMLITRGNLTYVDAIGWPWVSIRYALPMLPALCVASMVVVQRLTLRRVHALAGLALAALLVAWWWPLVADDSWWKRVLLLRVSLLGAAGLSVVAWREQGRGGSEFARWAVAALAALTLATGMGHDLRAEVLNKEANDAAVDRVLAHVPERFALVGVVGQFDVVLSALFDHDVEFADPERLTWFGDLRPSFDRWRAEKRPVFVYWTVPPASPWADISFVPVEPDSFLYRTVYVNDTH